MNTGAAIGPTGPCRFFRFTPAGLTVLYECGAADGATPSGLIQATDGAFYGTVSDGPDVGSTGGIFRLTVPQP